MSIEVGAGTPERAWADWPELERLPRLDLTGCRRAVVVAPHPDDETLGVGGLVGELLAAGADVVLLAVTDGEASHPDSPTYTPDQLGRVRIAETAEALAALGAGLPGRLEQVRLELPDGALTSHEHAVADAVRDLVAADDWCLAPFDADGHPDHEAAGRAARQACDQRSARLLAYPIWTWHWAEVADPRVPWSRARRLPLSAQAQRRKQAAIACFPSQTLPLSPAEGDAPILPAAELDHFTRAYEVVFV